MFERRTVLTNLAIIIALLSLILALVRLTVTGLMTREVLPYLVSLLGIIAVVTGQTLNVRYQRSKVFRPLIEGQLARMGYKYISERPLDWNEVFSNVEIVPSIKIVGIPILSGQRTHQNERILHVTNTDGSDFVLHVAITRTWESGTTIKIVNSKPVKSR